MGYYYVRDHADGTGTRTSGGSKTLQTGDWDTTFTVTGDYYASIDAALNDSTTAPSAGDVICCSHIHDHDYGAAHKTLTIPTGVIIISVTDTAIDSETTGAIERVNSGIYNLTISSAATAGKQFHKGITYKAGNNLLLGGTVESYVSMINCTLVCDGTATSDLMGFGVADGIFMEFINTDIQLPDTGSLSASSGFRILNGGKLHIKGGSLLFDTAKPNYIFSMQGGGGSLVVLDGFDMSNIGASGAIFEGLASNDDNSTAIVRNCLIPSGVSLSVSSIAKPGQRIEAYSTDNADQYYEMQIEDYYGSVVTNDNTIYRDNALTYDGTNRLSLEVTPTTANCIPGVAGIRFDLSGTRYADLSSSVNVTVYGVIDNTATAATQLTDHDVIIRVTRPDGTNEALGVVQESGGTSILKTATNLTAGSEVWTGDHATNSKTFEIQVTIPALTGVTDGRVSVEVEVMADTLHASDKIYICPDWSIA